MNMARHGIATDETGIALRWAACLLVVMAAHMAAVLLLRTSMSDHGTHAAPAAVLLDLAPELQAPPAPEPEPTPSPAPSEPVTSSPPESPLPVGQPPPLPQELPPVEPPLMEVPVSPTAQPEVVPPIPPPSPPRPAARTIKRPPAERATRSPPPPMQASPVPVQAAPQPGVIPTTWQDALRAHLARFKRYPMLAQRRGEEGTAMVRFTMNRAGTVLSVMVVRGTGHSALDHEAQQWIERAQPLPPPPSDVAGDRIELVIPLKFELR
jgi:periplasmic protein TonB